MKPEMLFLEEDRARFLERYRNTLATPAELADGKIITELGWRNRRKDGTPLDVEIYWSSMRWMGGQLRLVMARDVTAQKAAEAAMRDAEEKWRSLVECEMGFVMLIDKDDRITFSNRLLPDLDDDIVIGRKVYEFVSPKRRDAVRHIMETARQSGEAVALETLGRGPGGTEVWYDTQWVPIKRDGRVISLMCFATDITEQKRIHAELEEAKESAEHASMAKDRFLAILSHELRAPLCPVLAGVSALQEDGKLPARSAEDSRHDPAQHRGRGAAHRRSSRHDADRQG